MRIHSAMVLVLVALLSTSGCNDKKKADAPDSSGEDLEALRAECARIMPKTYASVWIGMSEEDLKKERPEASFQPQRSDPLEHRWYSETSPTGVKVWFGVDRESGTLGVVQFAHLFDSWATFSQHATALQDRFGTDYELYSCPSTAKTGKVAMTRLLWPRQPVAVMEAVLELGESVSVTMIVARVEDCRAGIEKQHCQRVDREKALDRWLEEQLDRKIEEAADKAKHGHGVTPPNATTPFDQPEHEKGEPLALPPPGDAPPGPVPAPAPKGE